MPSFKWRRTSEYLPEIACSRRNYAGTSFHCIAYGCISASTVVKNSDAYFVGGICVTFWGQNKMAAKITATFVTPFRISTGVCFRGSNCWSVGTDAGNCLASNWRQCFTWTSDGPVHWRHMATLGLIVFECITKFPITHHIKMVEKKTCRWLYYPNTDPDAHSVCTVKSLI